jgi:predicted nucleotide-binding protein (sugar kinase/HSP70/actin superfamily)
MQDERDIEIGRKYTSSRECFPMICTTGSFIRKITEPGFDPQKAAFFMPDHNGPCRFGQYNRFQRILFDKLGYRDVEIVSPSNENAYADLSGGHGNRFRLAALKGITAVDLLRKLKQERKPYESYPGDTKRVYKAQLDAVVESVEAGAKDILAVLEHAAEAFAAIPLRDIPRKPVIAVVGEIFMRDNPFCSGFIVDRLEALGAETLIAPMREWLTYSQYRYYRDSRWKGDLKGMLKSRIQDIFLNTINHRLDRSVEKAADMSKEVELHDMLSLCGTYVHRDYDGDPALNLGTCAYLSEQGISGIANILPFTCMPGTLVSALSDSFRADHDDIPWVNIAYDGQDDSGIETRLQAFMHQAYEYAEKKGLNRHPAGAF